MITTAWTVTEHRGRAGLERLEADWQRLCAAMPLRTTFHAYEACLAYVDHLMEAPEQLMCVALSDGREIRAIGLLEARMDRMLGIPIRVWGIPFHPHWPLADIVCPEDEARRAFLPAVIRHLRHHAEGRPLLIMGPLLEASVLWDGLQHLDRRDVCVDRPGSVHVMDCTKPLDEQMSRLNSSFRSKLRNRRRRLDELSDVRFVNATGPAEVAAEFEMFLDVEASGWKGASGTGSAIRLHPQLVAFYRDLATNVRPAVGHCEINSIYAEGRCLASQFCMLTGTVCASLKIAYDEANAGLSPGQLLTQRLLERCYADPQIALLSFVTDADWQLTWHPESVAQRQVYVALCRCSGRLLISLLRLRFGYGRRAVRWLRGQRHRLKGASHTPTTTAPRGALDQSSPASSAHSTTEIGSAIAWARMHQ